MNVLDIAILIFVLLESSNIIILYLYPNSKFGNGVAVFEHWEVLKKDEHAHLFVRYLVNWVANAKVVFILVLIVVLVFGSNTIKVYSIVAITISIIMYYLRLHPIIKALDQLGHIKPGGYSKKLMMMIVGIQALLVISLILYYSLTLI